MFKSLWTPSDSLSQPLKQDCNSWQRSRKMTLSAGSTHRTTQREPLLTTPTLERSRQHVGTDLFFWDKNAHLVVTISLAILKWRTFHVTSAETVISAVKSIFARHGVPVVLMSDNGLQFVSSLFKDFASEYGFTHTTSSPRYPQANGKAQWAVATVKGLWKEGGDYAKALLSHQATPLENSPATHGETVKNHTPTSTQNTVSMLAKHQTAPKHRDTRET